MSKLNKDDKPIIVEETFDASIEDVWNSITELEHMRKWYFNNIPSFKPEVGFETQFNVKSSDRNFSHMWRVTKVEPMKSISYNWKYKEYTGNSLVVFELEENYNKTKIRLTHQITESFPENIQEFKRESGVAGWNYFIKKSLKEYLMLLNKSNI